MRDWSEVRLRAKRLPVAGMRVRSLPSALRVAETGLWSVGGSAGDLAASERQLHRVVGGELAAALVQSVEPVIAECCLSD